jgi:hypothetical protein
LIDKLSFLKLGHEGNAASPEEERLKQLFQNRAGLKKAHADLKDELHLLRDRLKQQEGATLRVQEQLDSLGELLADPVTGYGALVFYQLRALWKIAYTQIAAFAIELTRTQEARELAKHREDFEAQRRTRLADADERLAAAAAAAEDKHAALAAVVAECERLTAIWHYFRRRNLQRTLEDLRADCFSADATVGQLHAERKAILGEPPTPFPGISLGARRSINLAIIAYAELACEAADAHGLTARAKEAMARRVHEMRFGSREDCEEIMQRVQKAIVAIAQPKNINGAVKARLDRLRTSCEYRNGADTVPTADSLGPAPSAGGRATSGSPWNVLAEDYWDLYTLLLR